MLTQLKAVNTILSCIGEAPVSSLESSSATMDVIMAINLLEQTSRDVQAEAWSFNAEDNVTLLPDPATGQIPIPQNALEVIVTPSIVPRNGVLYDRDRKTNQFTAGVLAYVVLALDYDALPHAAQNYIMIRAARQMQDRMGYDKQRSFTQQDEARARVALMSTEAESQGFNVLKNPDLLPIVYRNRTVY